MGGNTLTAFDDLELNGGRIGQAVWSPQQLLRDLELLSGVDGQFESEAVRVAKWVAKTAELAPLAALRRARVHFPYPKALLNQRAAPGWSRAVFAAKKD